MANLVTQSPVLRISSEDRIVDGDDGKLLYRGDLGRRQTFRFTRSVMFWPWGEQPGLGSGRLSIENGDGGYDQIALVDIRNRPAALSVLTDAGRVPIVTPIVDSVVADRDERVEFTLADGLAKFDVPAVAGFFEDDSELSAFSAAPEKKGQPLPILIGPCRSVPIVLWDPLHQGGAYRANYAPLAGVAGVFDSGVLLDPTAPQWEFDTRINNAGIFLNQSTAGKIVADVSATGDGALPDAPVDLLGGRAIFDTTFAGVEGPGTLAENNAGMPVGWQAAAEQSGPGDRIEFAAETATKPPRLRISHSDPSATQPFGSIFMVLTDSDRMPPFRVEGGKRYRIRFNLVRLDGGWSGVVAGFFVQNPPVLTLRVGSGGGASTVKRLAHYDGFSPSGSPGQRSLTITIPDAWDGLPLQIMLQGPFAVAEIADMEVIEVPSAPDATLPGLTLRDYMLEVVRLSGWAVDTVALDDLDAIDPLAASVGFFTAEQVQALSLMRAPLNSYTAGMYSDRAGKVRFTRMVDPAGETAEFFVNADNLARAPTVRLDPAKGLTTSATAQRNWYQYSENELAGSIAELPLADRIKFTQAARRTVNATVPDSWPEQYRHALNASPLPTLYDDEAVAQVEIQRIVDIYSTLRLIVDVEILVDGPDGLPEIGMIAELKYHRFGLADGRNMLVASITDIMEGEARQLKVTMRLWG